MSETQTPTRADIAESDKWDLTHLFGDVGKWQEDFGWVQQTFPKIVEWKGKLGASAKNLAECLEFEKSLELKIERLYHFASLQLAEDSANNEYLARVGQMQNLLTKIGETAAFVVPEIQAIDDEKFAKFVGDPALKDWRIKLAQSPANETARPVRAGRTNSGAGQRRVERLRRHIFAAHRCGHEVRCAH